MIRDKAPRVWKGDALSRSDMTEGRRQPVMTKKRDVNPEGKLDSSGSDRRPHEPLEQRL